MSCEVEAARSGPEALAMAPSFEHHVVIIDVNMPGMDGFETAMRLRARQAEGRAPTMVTYTAGADPSLLRRWKAAGCEHHLTKPASADAFEKVILERYGRDLAAR